MREEGLDTDHQVRDGPAHGLSELRLSGSCHGIHQQEEGREMNRSLLDHPDCADMEMTIGLGCKDPNRRRVNLDLILAQDFHSISARLPSSFRQSSSGSITNTKLTMHVHPSRGSKEVVLPCLCSRRRHRKRVPGTSKEKAMVYALLALFWLKVAELEGARVP